MIETGEITKKAIFKKISGKGPLSAGTFGEPWWFRVLAGLERLRLRAERPGRAAAGIAVGRHPAVDGTLPFLPVLCGIEETVSAGGHGRMILPPLTWSFAYKREDVRKP